MNDNKSVDLRELRRYVLMDQLAVLTIIRQAEDPLEELNSFYRHTIKELQNMGLEQREIFS